MLAASPLAQINATEVVFALSALQIHICCSALDYQPQVSVIWGPLDII
jgi:hypothetical protein